MPNTTISLTVAQLNRAKRVVGLRQRLQDVTDPDNPVSRDATAAEFKQTMIRLFKQYVQDYERQELKNAVITPDFDPT